MGGHVQLSMQTPSIAPRKLLHIIEGLEELQVAGLQRVLPDCVEVRFCEELLQDNRLLMYF